jgi:hypothetical protein
MSCHGELSLKCSLIDFGNEKLSRACSPFVLEAGKFVGNLMHEKLRLVMQARARYWIGGDVYLSAKRNNEKTVFHQALPIVNKFQLAKSIL